MIRLFAQRASCNGTKIPISILDASSDLSSSLMGRRKVISDFCQSRRRCWATTTTTRTTTASISPNSVFPLGLEEETPALRRRTLLRRPAESTWRRNFVSDQSREQTKTTTENNNKQDAAESDAAESDSAAWAKQLSKREMADLEDHLSRTVGSKAMDPCLEQSLASLQWLNPRVAISADGTFQVLLKLPTLLHPQLDELKRIVRETTEQEIQAWLSSSSFASQSPSELTIKVNVEAMATKPVPVMARLVEDHEELLRNLGPGLAGVSHFAAVYSCKGGVGKSTVSVNLAYELARMGGRVGLLDLDIYGPSLPILVHPDDPAVRHSPRQDQSRMVLPIEHGGVKLLSLGFVSRQSGVPGSGQDNGASVMRGPMVGKVVTQLLKGTDWGDLDILLLDLPPGTGDVQLAVLQELQLSGAVAVTTPSKLAAVDTRKGIQMFTSLGVPTLAVVENMSYFEVEGVRHYPFGHGLTASDSDTDDKDTAVDQSTLVQLPISPATNSSNDSGKPFCLTRREDAKDEIAAFGTLARIVSGKLLKYQYGHSDDRRLVSFDKEGSESFDVSTVVLSIDKAHSETFLVRLFSDSGAIQKRVSAALLRSRDPKTGDELTDSPFLPQVEEVVTDASESDPVVMTYKSASTNKKQSPALIPTNVERKGRYGFAVQWADGATIIYSTMSLARAAGGVLID